MLIAALTVSAPAVARVATPSSTGVKHDLALGRKLFRANCGGCHTLADAGTHGKVGPNLGLDTYHYATVVWMIRTGNSTMPAFQGTLTLAQIQDVAAYIAKVTGS